VDIIKLTAVLAEARVRASIACHDYYENHLGGHDQFPCGFAWVEIHEYDGVRIRGNTRVGKRLAECGLYQSHSRVFTMWDPGNYPVQNVDCKIAGCEAAAEVLRGYGFTCYVGSRWD